MKIRIGSGSHPTEKNEMLKRVQHDTFGVLSTFVLSRQRLCRNRGIGNGCHSERSEESNHFNGIDYRDFSPKAQNDNCDTAS